MGLKKMVYQITIEKDFEKKLEQIKSLKFREYTRFLKKIDEIKHFACIRKNHKTRFNTFDKPLQNYKWVEIDDKILIFTLNPIKQELHLCDYLPKEEVFE